MVAVNFTLEGAPEMILSGRKRTTFRKFKESRNRAFRQAQNLELYWKQRTSECRKIADAELTMVGTIPNMSKFLGYVDDIVAHIDGFDSIEDMRAFFSAHYTEEELSGPFHIIEFKVRNEQEASA